MKKNDKLTPQQKQFAIEYANTGSGAEAIRRAYPGVANSSSVYQSVKANRLLKKDNVQSVVEYQRKRLEALTDKAVNRVDKLIDSDNEAIASNNSWRVIEQSLGRAVQRSESVNMNISLQDALDMLK